MDLASRIRPFGLSQVYESPQKPIVDIVFVHGLNGHPHRSWTSKTTETFWPADLLPEVLASNRVRILTYGYNANITAFTDGASNDRILNHAETLTAQLRANRSLKGCIDRPIIFVCHSLGGLVVKRALIYSRSITDEKIEHLRSIYVSTYGILFLGTPHNGSDVAKWGLLLQNICSAVLPRKFMDSSPHLVKALKTNNETLQNINSLFTDMMPRFHIYFFHETLPTDVKGTRGLIVDESSAAPYANGVERMGIEADHSHMCKFDDESSPGYEAVAEALLRYSRDAPATVYDRWVEEDKTRRLTREARMREIFCEPGHSAHQGPAGKAREKTPDSPPTGKGNLQSAAVPSLTSSTVHEYEIEEPLEAPYPFYIGHVQPLALPPPEENNSPVSDNSTNLSRSWQIGPIWVVPPGFHPNATFFGMKKELEVLHARLVGVKKNPEKLRAVLICGVPGSGKSHLARQYVWTHRDHYPGGIFWIDAKSRQSTFKCFWDIAQAATLIDSAESQNPDSKSTSKYVEAVRNWLQGRDAWLMIFDGISFALDEEINEFKQFLPYKERCGIIYTSVDKTLRKKQRLYEPYCLMIRPLEVDDARKLLFKDLGIKRATKEQIQKATEVVNHYECLPLAIHAISHRLSATDKPIERYHISSQYFADEKLAEPFLSIMHDLYWGKHFAALNLINLLSFLGHHIPVGLITLGLSFLQGWNIEVLTSSRPEERGDFDTTLGILIRYGLIERTSNAYPLQPQSSSPQPERQAVPELSESQTESSQEGFAVYQNAGTTDVIKIHSVVQGFCRDELRKMDKELKKRTTSAKEVSRDAGYYESWLVVATQVFCASYGNAKERMNRVDDCGLVKDYREYETHASQLIKNFPKKTSHEMVREALVDLRQALQSVRNEIERISPSSSQESIRKHRSVFDRSSSSSSFPESSASDGPSRQLTLDFSDVVPSKAESPQEMRMSPQHVNLGPFIPHIFRESSHEGDPGYETEDEAPGPVIRTSPAISQISQATERPKSSQASSPPHQDDEGWHVVENPSRMKPEKPRQWKQRPRFPPKIRGPKPAAPVLEKTLVQGRSASSDMLDKKRNIPYVSASQALTAVHQGSPPSHEDIRPLLDLRQENTPTYASVASRFTQDPVSQAKQRSASSPGGRARPVFSSGLQSNSSVESLHSRSSNILFPSLSSEYRPDPLSQSMYSEPDQGQLRQINEFDLGMAYEFRHPAHRSAGPRRVRPVDMSASTPSIFTGLPYESNISVSRRVNPSVPPALSQSSTNLGPVTHPSAIMPGASPPSSHGMDTGTEYASDPAPESMSRGASGQSHHSWATEPARYPPRISPISSSIHPQGLPQQQTLSGAGSWVTDMPQTHPLQAFPSAPQPDKTYAAVAQRRPARPPLDTNVVRPGTDPLQSSAPVWPPLYFDNRRVDPEAAHHRRGGYPPIQLQAPPYPMYHENRSGPLIPTEGAWPRLQQMQNMRARSGSSPTRYGYDGLGLDF